MPDAKIHPFRRERVRVADSDAFVVRSTCKKCSMSFVMDVRDGLDAAEDNHAKTCRKETVSLEVVKRGPLK